MSFFSAEGAALYKGASINLFLYVAPSALKWFFIPLLLGLTPQASSLAFFLLNYTFLLWPVNRCCGLSRGVEHCHDRVRQQLSRLEVITPSFPQAS